MWLVYLQVHSFDTYLWRAWEDADDLHQICKRFCHFCFSEQAGLVSRTCRGLFSILAVGTSESCLTAEKWPGNLCEEPKRRETCLPVVALVSFKHVLLMQMIADETGNSRVFEKVIFAAGAELLICVCIHIYIYIYIWSYIYIYMHVRVFLFGSGELIHVPLLASRVPQQSQNPKSSSS